MQATFGDPRYYRKCPSNFACGTPMENDANTEWFAADEGLAFFAVAAELRLIASLALGPQWQPALRDASAGRVLAMRSPSRFREAGRLGRDAAYLASRAAIGALGAALA